jgi:hypothetical protein
MRWHIAMMLNSVMAVVTSGAAGQVVLNVPGQVNAFGEDWKQHDCAVVGGLNAVWGVSRNEVYAVGAQGSIVKFDGSSCRPQVNGTFETLRGVWGSSSADLWAVGDGGAIVRSDGGAWRPSPVTPPTENNLAVIWGTARDDVFAVGEHGTILHFDGVAWRQQESGTDANLVALWGKSSRDVYVAGAGSTLLHFDGARWKNLLEDAPPLLGVDALWAAAGGGVYIVGVERRWVTTGPEDAGGPMIWYGAVFEVFPGRFPVLQRIYGLDVPVDAIHVSPAGDACVFVAPRRVLHLEDRISSVLSESAPGGTCGLWRAPTGDLFAVSRAGAILYQSR